MHYLVATDSVHTTAAACDYLDPRLDGPGADTVTVLTVTDGTGDVPGPDRDAGDAANVARARLTGRATVETATATGDPATVVLETVAERDADVLVLGPRSGDPESGEDAPRLGGTARAVLARASVPAVVVPVAPPATGGVE
jgi:nucleotide-binding universal stress UspA family protein